MFEIDEFESKRHISSFFELTPRIHFCNLALLFVGVRWPGFNNH